MTSDGRKEGDSLTDDQMERIRERCRRHEFPLARSRRHRDILILVPRSVDALPGADRLEALAGELEDDGFRFVTFSVPEEDETPQ